MSIDPVGFSSYAGKIPFSNIDVLPDEKILTYFDYTSSSPLLATTIVYDGIISDIRTVVDIPFDDATATLSVGTLVDNDLFQEQTENDLSIVGSYTSSPEIKVSQNDEIYLTLNFGSSTQGSGWVIIYVTR